MNEYYTRALEEGQLKSFIEADGPGYTHLRGRRRVGKSELLKLLCVEHTKSMYFYGSEDETTVRCIDRFIEGLETVFPELALSELKRSARTWDRIFKEVERQAVSYGGPVLLVLDEIQWIAKQKSGFAGILKHHWSEWKKTTKIKLILCGSSNKFFTKNTDGEFNALRGLKTHADIWVRPFSLREVKNSFLKNKEWSDEQIALLYMMIGGIPYYLEQISEDNNFYRAINKTIFTSSTIFLDEVRAILKLEFNSRGLNKILSVLSSLGQDGATLAQISKITGIHKQTTSDIVGKLCDYELLFEKYPLGMKKKADNSDIVYYMKDFYLNLYFKVLSPLESRIKNNTQGMLFNRESIQSDSGHYIENFSGKAFELLVRYVLENSKNKEEKIFQKLNLIDLEFNVGTFWIPKVTQIDLIAESKDDRESRIIEVKWINKPLAAKAIETEILKKQYTLPKGFKSTHFLVSNNISSTAMKKVKAIYLKDLF